MQYGLDNEGYELKNWEQDNMNWIHFANISINLDNEGYELKNWEQDNMNWIHFANISINLDKVSEIRWNHCSKPITKVYFTQCDDYPMTDILEYEERKKLALAVGYPVENLQIN